MKFLFISLVLLILIQDKAINENVHMQTSLGKVENEDMSFSSLQSMDMGNSVPNRTENLILFQSQPEQIESKTKLNQDEYEELPNFLQSASESPELQQIQKLDQNELIPLNLLSMGATQLKDIDISTIRFDSVVAFTTDSTINIRPVDLAIYPSYFTQYIGKYATANSYETIKSPLSFKFKQTPTLVSTRMLTGLVNAKEARYYKEKTMSRNAGKFYFFTAGGRNRVFGSFDHTTPSFEAGVYEYTKDMQFELKVTETGALHGLIDGIVRYALLQPQPAGTIYYITINSWAGVPQYLTDVQLAVTELIPGVPIPNVIPATYPTPPSGTNLLTDVKNEGTQLSDDDVILKMDETSITTKTGKQWLNWFSKKTFKPPIKLTFTIKEYVDKAHSMIGFMDVGNPQERQGYGWDNQARKLYFGNGRYWCYFKYSYNSYYPSCYDTIKDWKDVYTIDIQADNKLVAYVNGWQQGASMLVDSSKEQHLTLTSWVELTFMNVNLVYVKKVEQINQPKVELPIYYSGIAIQKIDNLNSKITLKPTDMNQYQSISTDSFRIPCELKFRLDQSSVGDESKAKKQNGAIGLVSDYNHMEQLKDMQNQVDNGGYKFQFLSDMVYVYYSGKPGNTAQDKKSFKVLKEDNEYSIIISEQGIMQATINGVEVAYHQQSVFSLLQLNDKEGHSKYHIDIFSRFPLGNPYNFINVELFSKEVIKGNIPKQINEINKTDLTQYEFINQAKITVEEKSITAIYNPGIYEHSNSYSINQFKLPTVLKFNCPEPKIGMKAGLGLIGASKNQITNNFSDQSLKWEFIGYTITTKIPSNPTNSQIEQSVPFNINTYPYDVRYGIEIDQQGEVKFTVNRQFGQILQKLQVTAEPQHLAVHASGSVNVKFTEINFVNSEVIILQPIPVSLKDDDFDFDTDMATIENNGGKDIIVSKPWDEEQGTTFSTSKIKLPISFKVRVPQRTDGVNNSKGMIGFTPLSKKESITEDFQFKWSFKDVSKDSGSYTGFFPSPTSDPNNLSMTEGDVFGIHISVDGVVTGTVNQKMVIQKKDAPIEEYLLLVNFSGLEPMKYEVVSFISGGQEKLEEVVDQINQPQVQIPKYYSGIAIEKIEGSNITLMPTDSKYQQSISTDSFRIPCELRFRLNQSSVGDKSTAKKQNGAIGLVSDYNYMEQLKDMQNQVDNGGYKYEFQNEIVIVRYSGKPGNTAQDKKSLKVLKQDNVYSISINNEGVMKATINGFEVAQHQQSEFSLLQIKNKEGHSKYHVEIGSNFPLNNPYSFTDVQFSSKEIIKGNIPKQESEKNETDLTQYKFSNQAKIKVEEKFITVIYNPGIYEHSNSYSEKLFKLPIKLRFNYPEPKIGMIAGFGLIGESQNQISNNFFDQSLKWEFNGYTITTKIPSNPTNAQIEQPVPFNINTYPYDVRYGIEIDQQGEVKFTVNRQFGQIFQKLQVTAEPQHLAVHASGSVHVQFTEINFINKGVEATQEAVDVNEDITFPIDKITVDGGNIITKPSTSGEWEVVTSYEKYSPPISYEFEVKENGSNPATGIIGFLPESKKSLLAKNSFDDEVSYKWKFKEVNTPNNEYFGLFPEAFDPSNQPMNKGNIYGIHIDADGTVRGTINGEEVVRNTGAPIEKYHLIINYKGTEPMKYEVSNFETIGVKQGNTYNNEFIGQQMNGDCVVLFSECDYKGEHQELCVDAPDLERLLQWKHTASVFIPRGLVITVNLHNETVYEGEWQSFTESTPCIDHRHYKSCSFLQLAKKENKRLVRVNKRK